MTRARLQVDDEYGTGVVFLDVDLTDAERVLLGPIVEPLAPADREYLLARLIRAKADEEAYERVIRDLEGSIRA